MIGPVWFAGPTPDDLALFWGDEAPTEDPNWATMATARLTEAADLFFLVTGLSDVPTTDPRLERLINYAIMDMATKLFERDPSEANSPYTSERIGSYSYTLKQTAMSGVGTTGVFWWDLVIEALATGNLAGALALVIDGEEVFSRPFVQFNQEDRLLHPIPLVRGPGWEVSQDPSGARPY